jgi:hypothetical protein
MASPHETLVPGKLGRLEDSMGRWAVLPYHERRDGNALQDSARYDLPALMGRIQSLSA